MSVRVLLGLLLLLVAALGALAYTLVQNGTFAAAQDELNRYGLVQRYEPLLLRGVVAGDKAGLLDDPEIRAYLKNRYNLQLELLRGSSLEMVRGNVEHVDFLWPSGELALQVYKSQSRPFVREEIVLNSPLVLYSWDGITSGLEASGVVAKTDAGYYTVDLARLAAAMAQGKEWSDLGVAGLRGKVRVIAADPTKANAGAQFAGLLATAMNGGEVVDAATLDDYLPPLKRYFAGLGFLQGSSAELFAQYLRQGAGSYPIVVGYESQLVEHGLKNRAQLAAINEQVRVLYPQPTVWASHPLIAVKDGAKRLADALLDPEVQRVARAKHGFRTGLGGTWGDAGALPIAGLAGTVDDVAAMPSAAVLARIVEELGRPEPRRGY